MFSADYIAPRVHIERPYEEAVPADRADLAIVIFKNLALREGSIDKFLSRVGLDTPQL